MKSVVSELTGSQVPVQPRVASSMPWADRGAGEGSGRPAGSRARSPPPPLRTTAPAPMAARATAATTETRRVCRRRREVRTASSAPGPRVICSMSCWRSAKRSSRSKVSGMARFSVRRVAEHGGKGGPAAGEPRLDGALRAAFLRCDLGHGEAGQVVQHEGASLGVGQRRSAVTRTTVLSSTGAACSGGRDFGRNRSRPGPAPAADRLAGWRPGAPTRRGRRTSQASTSAARPCCTPPGQPPRRPRDPRSSA